MSEKIFLTYTNATAVPYQGSVLGHHVVLNYIDSNGFHHTLQGVPEHSFNHNIDKLVASGREEMFSDGANNRDSPFHRLRAKMERSDRGVSLNQPHTIVAEGDDLSSRWALMQDFADEVNSIGYEYRPISQNSNSFAGGALQRAGFFGTGTEFPERSDSQLVFDPVSGETRSFNVPGFEKPLANPLNTSTPMPFPSGALAAPDRQDSFGDRFGNWTSSPAGITPRNPNLPAAPPEPGPPLGIFSGKPMQLWMTPPPLGGLPDNSDASGNGDWFNFLAGIASRNPTEPAPPPGGSKPVRYLGRRIVDQSQAPVFDTSAPAVPFVLSDDQNFSDGLAGRIAAVAGIDSQNPTRLAPPPLDDGLRRFYRDDPVQPWFVQRQR